MPGPSGCRACPPAGPWSGCSGLTGRAKLGGAVHGHVTVDVNAGNGDPRVQLVHLDAGPLEDRNHLGDVTVVVVRLEEVAVDLFFFRSARSGDRVARADDLVRLEFTGRAPGDRLVPLVDQAPRIFCFRREVVLRSRPVTGSGHRPASSRPDRGPSRGSCRPHPAAATVPCRRIPA